MFFRQYSTMFHESNKQLAKTMFLLGLGLIGFAMIVWVLKDVFAFIAMGLLVLAGVWCCGAAVKIWIVSRKISSVNNPENQFRENVTIHYEDEDTF